MACYVQVIVNLYSAHMNPEKWVEPRSFKPERFLNDLGQNFGKDRNIPFSLGKLLLLKNILFVCSWHND